MRVVINCYEPTVPSSRVTTVGPGGVVVVGRVVIVEGVVVVGRVVGIDVVVVVEGVVVVDAVVVVECVVVVVAVVVVVTRSVHLCPVQPVKTHCDNMNND